MFAGIYFIFSALSSLHVINGAATEANDNSTIMFLEPRRELTQEFWDEPLDIPEECLNQNYCTIRPKNYPPELNNEEQVPEPTYVKVDNRAGDPDEIDGCETVVEYKQLYIVKTVDGKWRAVIPFEASNILQFVRLEKCVNIGGSCFTDYLRFPRGATAVCEQKYTPWSFVVYEPHRSTSRVHVMLPTCCVCRYTKPEA